MQARDSATGRIVTFSERRSIILTILTILAAIGFVASLIILATAFFVNPVLGLLSLLLVVSTLIYVVVFNHLRKKGDMDTDLGKFQNLQGSFVEVRKKRSFWITLAMVLVGIFLVLSLIGLGVSLSILSRGSLLAFIGGFEVPTSLAILIVSILYLAVLNFLRTKLDFEGDSVEITSEGGGHIRLYKRRSFWITLAMVFSLFSAVAFLSIGAWQGTSSFQAVGANPLMGALFPANHLRAAGGLYGLVSSAYYILLAVIQLVNVAVFNFLRVRGHVEILAPTTI